MAASHLQAALAAGQQAGVDDYDVLPNLGVAALHLGDLRAYAAIHEQMLSRAREEGALVVVLYALTRLAFSDIAYGSWATATARQTEAVQLGTATQQPVLGGTPRAALLVLSALREDPSFEQQLQDLRNVINAPPAGVLGNLLRDLVRWAQAVHASPRSAAGFHHLAQMTLDITRRQAGVDRIEAAVHTNQRELARAWTEDLEQFAAATGGAWAAAIAAHGRALLAAPTDADDHFEAALDQHSQGGRPFDRARTQFAYGEHLRRTRRRVAAREQLRTALQTFDDLNAVAWIERAQTELRATGESIRNRQAPSSTNLTPQELQVAQLVQRGLSNRDAAARLFVSPRTIDFHLRNIFTKTGVRSRTELAQLALG
jgi:DNA-binding CsgD family transcriptional regulator